MYSRADPGYGSGSDHDSGSPAAGLRARCSQAEDAASETLVPCAEKTSYGDDGEKTSSDTVSPAGSTESAGKYGLDGGVAARGSRPKTLKSNGPASVRMK